MANFHGKSIGPDRYPLVEWLILVGCTAHQIAHELGVEAETIRKFARKRGMKIQRQDMTLENHPAWKGGATSDRQGYILRYVEADGEYGYLIRALQPGRSRGYAPVHRIRMHDKLGRRLLPDEVVHHIDGDIWNNDPNNLDVYSTNAEHLRDTLAGKVPNWTPEGRAKMTGRPPKRRPPEDSSL